MLAERLPLRSLWLGAVSAFGALAGMVALRCATASLTAPAPVICTDVVVEAPPPPTPEALEVRVDRLYRSGNFAAAAQLVRDSHPIDVDLQNLAEQLERLALTWQVGFDETGPAADRFVALREAWKLDTVLGGAFTDELYTALASIAPKARAAFLDAGDFASAETAADTIAALGPR
jgi:hypothetical protein